MGCIDILRRRDFVFRTFFKDGIRFLMPMLSAVLLGGLLLVPAAMALGRRQGRKGKHESGIPVDAAGSDIPFRIYALWHGPYYHCHNHADYQPDL